MQNADARSCLCAMATSAIGKVYTTDAMCAAGTGTLLIHCTQTLHGSLEADMLSLQALCCMLLNLGSLPHKTEGSKEWLSTQGQLKAAEPLGSA